jgi:hypothetical protein
MNRNVPFALAFALDRTSAVNTLKESELSKAISPSETDPSMW